VPLLILITINSFGLLDRIMSYAMLYRVIERAIDLA